MPSKIETHIFYQVLIIVIGSRKYEIDPLWGSRSIALAPLVSVSRLSDGERLGHTVGVRFDLLRSWFRALSHCLYET